MAFVNRVSVAETDLNGPSWDVVEAKLLGLKEIPHSVLSLYGDADAQMMVEFVEAKGSALSENLTATGIP